MSDPLTTQDVTLYDENANPVDVVLDSGNKRRVCVDAQVSANLLGGKDLWQTETENGKGFSVLTGGITIASTDEVPICLIKNPVASGKIAEIYQFRVAISKGTAVVRGTIRIYRNPTITANGTALTINKLKISQSASSVMSAYKSPTISANGTQINNLSVTTENNILISEDLGRFIEANENMLVTFEPSTSGTNVSFFTNWIEV